MSYIWNLTKSISTKLTGSSEFFTISSKDENGFNTISTNEKGRLSSAPPKSVSFGEVTIIEVESYKYYNQLDLSDEIISEENCMSRCGTYCKCNIF